MEAERKWRPIVFSGPMVTSIQRCAKRQTRRIIPLTPGVGFDGWSPETFDVLASGDGTDEEIGPEPTGTRRIRNPYGVAGDGLWVKETWSPDGKWVYPFDTVYRADFDRFRDPALREHVADGDGPHPDCFGCEYNRGHVFRWRSPRFMPRKESRLSLELTKVRVERLHEMTEEDARWEGIGTIIASQCSGKVVVEMDKAFREHGRVAMYSVYWDHINGRRVPWKANPWCWVLEFQEVRP